MASRKIDTQDNGYNGQAIVAAGKGALTPDAGGGFLAVPADGALAGAVVVASYDVGSPFTVANAGFLLAGADLTGAVSIVSSKIADDNVVQWFAIK
jgi:hypothetical protein